jgi:hypothetical protein
MSNIPTRTTYDLAELLNLRRQEEDIPLSAAVSAPQSQIRSEITSCSSEDLIHSGAFPGEDKVKKDILDKTRHKRLEAYMSLDSKSVAQTRGWRIRAAYRLTCYMARICGGLQGPMMLQNLFHSQFQPDPSCYPFKPPDQTEVFGAGYIIQKLQELTELSDTYTIGGASGTLPCGFTYLPPSVPDSAYGGGDPRMMPYKRQRDPIGYDPEQDASLGIWLDVYSHLAMMLHLHDGTKDEPESGVFGTVGMFSSNSARLLWPTRDELLQYEEELMLRIFDHLCQESVQEVENQIVQKLGYGRLEAVLLAKTALRYGTGVYESDIDMAKVRELKSLEIISDKAKAGDDPRAQIAARKQYQLVAGLTKDSSMEESEQFRTLATKALADDDLSIE